MRFREYIEEINNIKFLVNPTGGELAAYVRKIHKTTADFDMRGLLVDNNLYFWDAYLLTHQQAAIILREANYLDKRLTVYITKYNEVMVDFAMSIANNPLIRKLNLDEDGVILEDSRSDAEDYFSIGHGDFNDEHGFEPDYIVWAFVNGVIETSPRAKINSQTGYANKDFTHGTMWGHDVTNRTYKGRYEPQTGNLSIASPEPMREVPSIVLRALHKKFKNIQNIRVF